MRASVASLQVKRQALSMLLVTNTNVYLHLSRIGEQLRLINLKTLCGLEAHVYMTRKTSYSSLGLVETKEVLHQYRPQSCGSG